MTKEEFLQEMVLRLFAAMPHMNEDYVINRAVSVTEALWKRMGYENDDKKDETFSRLEEYQALCEEVKLWRGIKCNHVNSVAGALMNEESFVSLQEAKSLSCFYGRIPTDTIKLALLNGDIYGKIPKKTMIKTTARHNGVVSELKREQSLGKYELKVGSLVCWLESKYTRRVSKDSLVYKHLDRIART